MAELLLEFDGPEGLARAARELEQKGYTGLEAYTPYSTEEVRAALPERFSWIPCLVLLAGLCGAGGAYLLQWYLVAYLYPIDAGGRPPHMPLAFVPISFEMGVLCAAFAAFLGVLWAGRLLRPWHPVFEAQGFESTSVDKFWLSVPASDVPEGREALERVAASLGAQRSLYVASEVRR
ncbi:MAG TPA: DUF3341 domain-containing protein [Polyangiaceae bacterium]|jgi:hypothetical protein|nr:DUF3341 domain-containing protein [Polyangiaceae bacterium]